MAVSDPNKFASVGNVKALFDSGEGFVHEANIDPDYSLVPLTGTSGQVLTRTEGGVGWREAAQFDLLFEGNIADGGSITASGIEKYNVIAVDCTGLLMDSVYLGREVFGEAIAICAKNEVAGGTAFLGGTIAAQRKGNASENEEEWPLFASAGQAAVSVCIYANGNELSNPNGEMCTCRGWADNNPNVGQQYSWNIRKIWGVA